MSGHTYTVIGVLAEKGTSFGQSQDDICFMPITRFFENYGEANRTVNIATQPFSTELYRRTLDKGNSAMRIARGLRADQENDSRFQHSTRPQRIRYKLNTSARIGSIPSTRST